jgi:copper chaperone
MENLTLSITGMTCEGCVRSVKKVLEGVQGVAAAEVSLEQGQARVTFDPAQASLAQLKQAVEDAGYEAG